ncbi:hypothetical protein EVAR_98361_1 [Eumeta japonica]|uniref:Uncharacterized protein n=1 Tax=Eumeta variegata TaxID=151549 RepID=A0A4C2A842_EUMVA|nr:hypothetical protein EVAR_98361_1 [Eumeta japonica]
MTSETAAAPRLQAVGGRAGGHARLCLRCSRREPSELGTRDLSKLWVVNDTRYCKPTRHLPRWHVGIISGIPRRRERPAACPACLLWPEDGTITGDAAAASCGRGKHGTCLARGPPPRAQMRVINRCVVPRARINESVPRR